MILDCYNQDLYRVNQIKSFEISFSAESLFEDEIEIARSSQDGFDIIQGTNTKNLKEIFISRIGWGW